MKDSAEATARGIQQSWFLAGITAVLVLLHVNLTWQDGDEDRHVLVARAMAEGLGQTDIYLPVNQPEVMTPPAYPWLLSRLWKIWPDQLVPRMAFSAICYVLFAIVLVRWLRRDEQPPALSAGAAILGLGSVFALTYVWRIFSETFYMLVTYLAFLAAARSEKNPSSRAAIGVGLLAALSALIRPVGIALFPAGVLYYAIRRRWKSALLFAGAVLLVYGPFMLRTYRLAGVPIPHMLVYEEVGEAAAVDRGAALAGLVRVMSESLPYYFFHALPRRMFFALFDENCLLCLVHLQPLVKPLAGLVSLLILSGFLIRLRRMTLAELFWLCYWPMLGTFKQWPQDRYLIPLIPLAALYLVQALEWIGRRLGRPRWSRAVAVLLAAYVLAAAIGAGLVRARKAWQVRELDPMHPARQEAIGWPDDLAFARFIEAGHWIRENAETNALVVSRKPRHLFLFSGRRGFRYDGVDIRGSNTWAIITSQRGLGPILLVQDGYSPESGYGRDRMGMLDPAIAGHADQLELLHETEPPVTRVWRVKDE
jgi:hypothetical protein